MLLYNFEKVDDSSIPLCNLEKSAVKYRNRARSVLFNLESSVVIIPIYVRIYICIYVYLHVYMLMYI
jgi:hypothetical protein